MVALDKQIFLQLEMGLHPYQSMPLFLQALHTVCAGAQLHCLHASSLLLLETSWCWAVAAMWWTTYTVLKVCLWPELVC